MDTLTLSRLQSTVTLLTHTMSVMWDALQGLDDETPLARRLRRNYDRLQAERNWLD